MSAVDEFRQQKEEKEYLNILCGFDGFVDYIVCPVKAEETEGSVYFETIEEFGRYLVSKAGKSCSLKLDTKQCRMGGNAPVFSAAAALMGEKVTCIGALGDNGFHTAFEKLAEYGNFFSIAEPGQSTALEFRDGKILLAQNSDLDRVDYERVAERIGEDRLSAYIRKADLIALLNWSELSNATNLWKGILENCFLDIRPEDGKRILVDLCDCSARTGEQLEEMFCLLQRFAQYGEVLLTLNENEADVLRKHFGIEQQEPLRLIRSLYEKMNIQHLVVHAIGYACGINQDECEYVPSQAVERPVISTGAGDHFNSGLAVTWGRGMCLKAALEIANAVTCFYVSKGVGPTEDDLMSVS